MQVLLGNKEYFKGLGQVKYEGPESDNPMSFRWYDENKMVGGKSLKEHFRFACAYWHSFVNEGSDPFGPAKKSSLNDTKVNMHSTLTI